jgi:hypothetical protein
MKVWLSFILFLFSYALQADVVYEKLDEQDYSGRQIVSITINKEIIRGDFNSLFNALNEVNQNNYRLKEDSIYLDSVGGLIHEAKQMGNLIRKHHHATKVNENAYCESACVLILVAGSCRMASGGVGIHRSKTDTNFRDLQDMNIYLSGSNFDNEYLKKMGTSQALFDIIQNVPSWTMRYLSDKTKLRSGLYTTPESESHYWQEVVSHKIAAPKSFLLDSLTNRHYELIDSYSWYQRNILKKDPSYIFPSCTEQMFLDQLEKYPNGTDKWGEQFEYYNSWQGYNRYTKDGEFDTFYGENVPLQKNVGHFWSVDFFKKGVKEITYREETTLSKPTEWEDVDESVKITMGGRKATRKVTVPNTGFITNGWTLDPKKDPAGPMTVKIYVDNKLVKSFNYRIVKPKK